MSVHEVTDADIIGINIPIIGGRAGNMILHLFSQDVAAASIHVISTVMNWITKGAVTPVKNQWQCGSWLGVFDHRLQRRCLVPNHGQHVAFERVAARGL